MHIKFLRHGQGSAAGAVRYLLGSHDHRGKPRAGVEVLRGDPAMVALVADSSRHQWGYTSGVIAWSPEDTPTPEQIAQVIEQWENTAFAGLEPDQYASCAVLHRDDDGTAHIHTLTARVELSSGRALNIAPPGHERLFDPLRDAWNHSQGWARPDDPDRARRVQPGHEQHRSRPDRYPRHRADITVHIESLVAEGQITTAADVRTALAELGEITRAGATYVSVRPQGAKKAIRLRGDLFRADWRIEQTLEKEARRAQDAAAGRAGRIDPGAAQRARERLALAVERRASYHRARYPREPDRDRGPDTIAALADQRPDVDDSAVGESPHDGIGNPAVAAVRAAAERIRAAGERAVGTATATADSAERAAERERYASPGDTPRAGAEAARDRGATAGATTDRPEKRGSVRQTDEAVERIIGAAERLVAAVGRVKTAYQAWMFRQAERDRQDREQAAEQRRAAPPLQPEPEPYKPLESQPNEAERAQLHAEKILLMSTPGERFEAIREADTGYNGRVVDAFDEQLAQLGVGHLGDLTPDGERRRARELGEPPEKNPDLQRQNQGVRSPSNNDFPGR